MYVRFMPTRPTHILFDDLCHKVLKIHEGSDKPRTFVVTRTSVRHLLKTFSGLPIASITPDSFYDLHVPRARLECPTRNLNNDRKIFIQVMNKAFRLGLIPVPPSGIPRPSLDGDIGREITDEELKKLFVACEDDLLFFQMEMALKTGMRLREMLSLKWEYIDLTRAAIFLPKTVTKTKRGRGFPICRILSQDLEYKKKRSLSPFVFPSATNPGKFQYDNRYQWRKLKKTADVKCRWHDFRHTCATRMLRAGAPISHVSQILGMSERVLRSIYNHLNVDDLRESATKVDYTFLKKVS